MPVHPTVLALVLADGIHRDDHGKAYLLGVFNTFNAPTFPATLPRSALYLSLAGGRGAVPVALRLIDAAEVDGPPLFAADVTIEFSDPLAVHEVAAVIPEVAFPRPGVYCWQVACGGAVLYERRLVVAQIAAPVRVRG